MKKKTKDTSNIDKKREAVLTMLKDVPNSKISLSEQKIKEIVDAIATQVDQDNER